MEQPPKQINVTYEILASMRRQEDTLNRILKKVVAIELAAVGLGILGLFLFLTEIVLKR